MVEIVIPGPVSGKRYGFRITGDTPTVDEQQRIDAILQQREGQFATEFEAEEGVRPAGAEQNILEYLGEFPKGIARGAVGMGESAALGIAGLLPEQYEAPTREAIRRVGYELSPQQDIGYGEAVSGKFGEALGSFLPLAAASVLPGGQVIAPTLAVGAGAGEASERARAAGATQEERNRALLPGAVVGAAELLPIKFIKALGRGDTVSLTQRVARAAATGGVEGAQEAATEVAQNLISRGIYDPEQGVFTGTGESAGYGAGVGGLVQGLLDLAIPGKPRAGQLQLPPPADVAPDGTPFDEPGTPLDVERVTTEIAPTVPESELPSPAAPVTEDTLKELGIPSSAPIYTYARSGELTQEQMTDFLERYGKAAAASDTPTIRDLSPRVLQYVAAKRAELREPTMNFDVEPEVAPDAPTAEPAPTEVQPIDGVVVPEPEIKPELDFETTPAVDSSPAVVAPEPEVTAAPPAQPKKPRGPRAMQRPFTAELVAATGGIDPAGAVAGELRARGITPQNSPMLFRRGGAKDLDNIPTAEWREYMQLMPDPAATYLDQDRIVELLEEEAAGRPVQVGEQAAMQERRDARAEGALATEAETALNSAIADEFSLAGVEITPTAADRAAVDRLTQTGASLEDATYDVATARLNNVDPDTLAPAPEVAPTPAEIDPADPFAESVEAYPKPAPTATQPAAQVEQTPAGAQTLAPGIEPVTDRQRAEAAMNAPKRGGDADITGGLFDVDGRAQTDFDFSPVDPNREALPQEALAQLRNNDLAGALRTFSQSAKNKTEKALARALADRLPNQAVQIVPDAEMLRIRDTLSPEMKTYGESAPGGVYLPMPSEVQMANLRANNRADVADIYEMYAGQILLNESAGMGSTTMLHEAAHAASDDVLLNPSHPLTRQLETLREKLLTFMPESTYGLLNVRELLAEGMTNKTFRRDLSLVNPDGAEFSAWDMFKNDVANFLRRLIGRKARPLGSAADEVSGVMESIIASSPSERGAGDVLSASFSPNGPQNVLGGFADKVRKPTREDLNQVRTVLRDVTIPDKWKRTMIWAAMPLDYIADAAVKYMPSARQMHDLIGQHKREQDTLIKRSNNTADAIAKHHEKHPDQVPLFEQVRFTATEIEMDPRKPRSEYEGFSYRYSILDSFGNPTDTVMSKRYKTEKERNAAMRTHNSSNIPNTSNAKRAFGEDTDKLEVFDALQSQYNSLNRDGKNAIDLTFALPSNLWKELRAVLQDRLEALMPGNRALQERIYAKIYNKVFAEQLIDPYQTLARSGEYGLSYSGVHPETGEYTFFTHSFTTDAARTRAIRLLESLGPEDRISSVTPFQQTASRVREKPPLQFVAQVLSAIEGAEGLDKSVQEQVVELVFDAAPETSFINSFRKRKGRQGYIGGVSPLERERLSPGDSIANIRSSAVRIAKNTADLKYGAKFAKARNELSTELAEFQNQPITDIVESGKDRAEAQIYHDALASYADSAFRARGATAQVLTGGAYALTLGYNVSTALLTMMSVPMFVAPFLAGKFGMRNTSAALGISGRLLAGTGRTRTEEIVGPTGETEQMTVEGNRFDYSIDNLDTTRPQSRFLAVLQDRARKEGIFNRSLAQDITDGAGELNPASRAGQLAKKVVANSGIFQHYSERYSRETALISTYLLALRKAAKDTNMGDFSVKQLTKKLEDGSLQFTPEQMDAAALEAVNTSEKTNGSLYAATGPQASQSDIGSILYLFKRHPLSMYNLLYQTMKRSLPSNASIEDKRVARFQLAGMGGMIALTSGALGLPLVQQMGWMYDLMAEDDEEDFETVVRIALGEYGAFGMVDYLTGLKMSERIGLGGAFYRPGFASEDIPLPFQIAEGVGGPVLGLMLKSERTMGLFADGEMWRGTESLMPSAVANAMRSVRYMDEGIRTRRHDPVIDDIGPFGATAQFFGFMPAEYARQLDVNAAGLRIDNAIRQKRRNLLGKLNRARTLGDVRLVAETLEEVYAFNARHPYNPITDDTMDRSERAFLNTTSRMHHGVQYTEKNMPRISETLNAFGAATPYK